MAPLDQAVELLDRALSYTRVVLNDVTDGALSRRTPCERWDLGQLLAHMEDALDAFTEGAYGEVDLDDRIPAQVRVGNLQLKACALLGAWSHDDRPTTVRIGDHELDTSVVVLAAALEITVHGWDVAQALGLDQPIPDRLARGLLPAAASLVSEADRGNQFGAPRPVPAEAADQDRLLGFLGRDARPGMSVPGPEVKITRNRHTGGAAAS